MTKVYLTTFPIRSGASLDDLANIAKTWLSGSPHRNLSTEILDELSEDGFYFKSDNLELKTIRGDLERCQFLCMRLIESHGKDTRTTDIVGHKNDTFRVSVSHDLQSEEFGYKRSSSKPRIVNDVVEEIGGGADGLSLLVQTKPIWVSNDELTFVSEILNGRSQNTLPVVYVSKDTRGQTTIHPNILSEILGGMAHVIVEPNKQFSFDLKRATNGANAYNGAIGIYWPNGMRELIFPKTLMDIKKVLFETVSEGSLFRVLPPELSYDGLLNLQTARKLDSLKGDRKLGVDEALNYAVDEIQRRDDQLGELQSRLSALESRLVQFSKQKNEGGIMEKPQLAELYPGELKDYLVETIEVGLAKASENTRRHDVLSAFTDCNDATGQRDKIIERLDSIFRGNPKSLTLHIQNQLRSLGFEVEYTGKHLKLYVPGCEERKYVLSTTPSDSRAGKNSLSGIKRTLL